MCGVDPFYGHTIWDLDRIGMEWITRWISFFSNWLVSVGWLVGGDAICRRLDSVDSLDGHCRKPVVLRIAGVLDEAGLGQQQLKMRGCCQLFLTTPIA